MSPSPKRVLLLIPRGAEVLETAAFFDVIGWANTYGSVPIEVTTVGLEREVRCTFGLRVLPDRQLNEVEPAEFDALALPGGFEEHGFYEPGVGPFRLADEDLEEVLLAYLKHKRVVMHQGAFHSM